MPTTSIIIATHSRPDLLRRAIASAHEAGTNVEVVVIDDASTDDTAQVCRRLSNIRYVRVDRNRGVAGARNIGLSESSGDYVTFLDDDDVRLPKSVDAQVEVLESRAEVGLVYGQALIANALGSTLDQKYPISMPEGNVFWQLLQQNFMPCGGVVFRRSCLSTVGVLDDKIPGIDDWDLWVRIAELYAVAAMDQPVMIWRQSHPSSGQGTSNAIRMTELARQQFGIWMTLSAVKKASAAQRHAAWRGFSENLAAHLVWDAARAARMGQRVRACQDIWTTIRRYPVGTVRLARRGSRLKQVWAGESELRPTEA